MKLAGWVGAWVIGAALSTGAWAQDVVPDDNFVDTSLRDSAVAAPVTTADGSALVSPASHLLLLDYDTGSVLAEKAGSQQMYPSSMTKMMTLYIVFQKLKEGTVGLDSQFTVSENAWRMQGSKMFVPIGGQVPLEELIRGIAIQSGNDACIVVAEGIAGSEPAFANMMNDTAKRLGMTGTHFVDASGWPHQDHYTTAHDLAILGAALVRDFPDYYHYFGEREFTYNNIRQFNRNPLLGKMGVDGLKTGHTESAGYGITLSAKDVASGRRLILVVNGLASEAERGQEGERLLKWGFYNFENKTLFAPGQKVVDAKVWMGKEKTVPLTVTQPVLVSVPRSGKAAAVPANVTYRGPIQAPVAAGEEVGILTVGAVKVPVVTGAAVEKLGAFGRAGFNIRRWLGMD